MNNLVKFSSRFSSLYGMTKPVFGKREFARTLWYMCKAPTNSTKIGVNDGITLTKPSFGCSCGCGSKYTHTKSERELVEFLTEEIVAEKKSQKMKAIPADIDGFKVKINGAEIELTKQTDKEKIVVNFNVNHTVDADDESEVDPRGENANIAEMRSKPQFEVDIVKGPTTLSFTCSFLQGVPQEGEYNDVFGIDEMTIYNGEWHDKIYAVAGDVLDGYLYDLLMNLLEEKGISNEFAEKLSDFSTAYEHTSYIGLLENVSKFTTGK